MAQQLEQSQDIHQPNPLRQIITPARLDAARAQVGNGNQLVVSVSIKEAKFDPSPEEGAEAFSSQPLTAKFWEFDGKQGWTPIEIEGKTEFTADLPDGGQFTALAGSLKSAFSEKATGLTESNPQLSSVIDKVMGALDEQSIKQIAGEEPVTGNSYLDIYIDAASGEPSLIKLEGDLSRAGKPVVETGATIDTSRIASVSGSGFSGAALLNGFLGGQDVDWTKSGLDKAFEGGTAEISVGVHPGKVSGVASLGIAGDTKSAVYIETTIHPEAAATGAVPQHITDLAGSLITPEADPNADPSASVQANPLGVMKMFEQAEGNVNIVARDVSFDSKRAGQLSLKTDFQKVDTETHTMAGTTETVDLEALIMGANSFIRYQDDFAIPADEVSVDIGLNGVRAPMTFSPAAGP